jgi:hypothetical protein
MTTSFVARCHLLQLRKKLRNDDELVSSPSFATPKKKNKEMTTNQGCLPPSVTPENKSKEMTTSQGGLPSFVTPKKIQKMTTLGGSRFIVISWVFSQV